jgi:hypothetical protein
VKKAVRPLTQQEVNALPRRWRLLCFRSHCDIVGFTWTRSRSTDYLAFDLSFSIGPWFSFTLHAVRSAGESG